MFENVCFLNQFNFYMKTFSPLHTFETPPICIYLEKMYYKFLKSYKKEELHQNPSQLILTSDHSTFYLLRNA